MSYVHLTVLECPPEQARAALAVIDGGPLAEDTFDVAVPDDDYVRLGVPGYSASGLGYDEAETIAHAMQTAAPDVLFRITSDADAEALGYGVIAGPGVDWRYTADHDGDPVFTADDVLAAVANGDSLEDALGVPSMERFRTACAKLAGLPVGDPRAIVLPECDVCRERRLCSCAEDQEDEAHALNDAYDRVAATA